jgi:hypothetical protein
VSTVFVRLTLTATRPSTGRIRAGVRAFLRHLTARLWGVLRDPRAIVVLAFVGFASIPLWSLLVPARPWPAVIVIENPLPETIDGDVRVSGASAGEFAGYRFHLPSKHALVLSTQPAVAAMANPLPQPVEADVRFEGAAARALGFYRFSVPRNHALVATTRGPSARTALSGWMSLGGTALWVVTCHFLWPPIVVLFVSGNVLVRRTLGSATGPPLPALPIGPRSRALAEALVALALVLVARTPGLLLRPELVSHAYLLQGAPQSVSGAASWAGTTILGALFVWPLLLAWAMVPRLDARGLLGPGIVMAALFFTRMRGMTASWPPAAALALTLSVLVLVLSGTKIELVRAVAESGAKAPAFRPSPGPLAQFRRDQWLGPLRALWPFLILVLPAPWALATVDRSFGPMYLTLQLLLLTAVLLYPLGLRLVSAAAPGTAALWNGYYVSAWSTLPVPRETVLRAAYAHAWAAGGLVWLLLCAYTALYARGPKLPLFEFPAVVLAAGVVLCAAAGDRRRGSLALASLVMCQAGVPMLLAVATDFVGIRLAHKPVVLFGAAYLLATVGGLPPVVHLRRS